MSEQTHDIVTINPRICRVSNALVMDYNARTTGVYGDIRYKAPEVVSGKPYDFKAEAWSYGVLLFFMLTGKLPFDQAASKKSDCHEGSDCSVDLNSLEHSIMHDDPPYKLL